LEGQIRLNEMSQDNIREIDENDVKIKSAQIQSLELTKRGKTMIETSLIELKKEQNLIQDIQNQLASSQDLLLHDTETISESLKEIITDLQNQNIQIVENYEQTMKQLKEISGFIRYVEVLKAMCDNLAIFVKEFGVDIESEY
jgi:predicted phage tail protein